MQATLAVIGFLLGVVAWWQERPDSRAFAEIPGFSQQYISSLEQGAAIQLSLRFMSWQPRWVSAMWSLFDHRGASSLH